MLQELFTKKSIYARPSLCKWLTHSNHTPRATGHHPIREMNNFSTYSIFDNVNHKKIWWLLQSQWTMCECANNIRSGYKYVAFMSDQLQLHPVKQKRKLEYNSHYMFHLI